MQKTALVITGLLLMMAPLTTVAQDKAAGQAKAAVCAACHGADGTSVMPDYPNLAGQKEKYLQSAITAYRDGSRKHAVMSPMANGLTDTDIANLAAYFASLPPQSPAK
ncbi:c-type cytochrome [Rheinheimera marina]|uniref:C-type cytochrome n=1 Tax=Rheinheimera marina TaxID=1774958 RepID=A0ABV9JJM5_9GAMM